MKLKKAFALITSAILVLIIFMIYSAKDLTEFTRKRTSIDDDFKDNKWLHFENRIKQLEKNLNEHHNAVHEMKEAMKNILSPSSSTTSAKNTSILHPLNPKPKFTISEVLYDSDTCPFQVNYVPRPDIQMLDMYKGMIFDNPNGGVWKQGWNIEIDEKDWNRQNKLNVFVVPHSHNDPGWIKTFDEYYLSQTKHILNNMLIKLPEDPRRKFIWAEISYFSTWWDDISEDEREAVKRLIKSNQLEIVTGGWVMNDEANSHWIAIAQQLTEGHQWLLANLNYTPTSSWAVDPFGMSLTQPLVLKEMGLKNLLIQRVHYSVKKELGKMQQLEFKWRQLWDDTGKTDLFTHLMPFYSYDIPHTCGPDPKICCQFDFKRLPGHGVTCPWGANPQEITDKNVAARAQLLLDQYRKKSKLFRTNTLLAPLGDDFRYDHPTEWDVQYNNYQKLFDYLNSNLNLNVQAQFGTLSDYFAAVHKDKRDDDFPSLSGDFFSYADRDDHYWSGYYTSRPFYKRMDRILMSYVRATEVILTLAHLSGKPGSSWISDKEVGLEKQLSDARKSLALFQHHDAITGTSKDPVVIDYAKKLLAAVSSCQHVIQHSAHILLNGENAESPDKNAQFYNIDDTRHSHDSVAEPYQITIGPELRTKRIVIFNSLAFTRSEVVTFHVSVPYVEVLDLKGRKVKCQVSPIFEYGSTMSQTKYQLSFIANIPAFSVISYVINALWEYENPPETSHASIRIYNQYGDVQSPTGFQDVNISPSSSEFTLQNSRIIASFSELGLLKAIKVGTETIPVHLDFARYGARHTKERSGAYLFLPDGDANPVKIENTIVNVIEGPIMSSVTVQLPYVHHTVTIYNSAGGDGVALDIQNLVDISKTSNYELAMRFSTNIKNADEFFTDVNGYQIMRRKRFKKLPIQANYYPMPLMTYIEDDSIRFSVLTGSPLGCSSLKEGQIEVMLDRRLNQDDNRGMGQGVLDNHPTRHVFKLLLEKRTHTCQTTANNHPAGFPTLAAHVASEILQNPLIRLLRTEDEDTKSNQGYHNVITELGVDLSLPMLRTGVTIKEKEFVGLVVHRQFVDLCFSDKVMLNQFPLSDGTVNISALFPSQSPGKVYKSSLSFLHLEKDEPLIGDVSVCPMEIQAFTLQR